MFYENGKMVSIPVTINFRDAKRIVDSLEFTADFDKTEIYYILKEWVDETESKQAPQ